MIKLLLNEFFFSDVKLFALQVRKHGPVQIGHRIGERFLESSRKTSGTFDDIPDIEIKENLKLTLNI